ncbi:hypothetical protein KJ032_26970, partial [Salmonella enterica subsp. enterica serovar Typhimurium]|nr:hypothetical protein [Salmonella enterica subsp. enterica serovar Typhimurium]
HAEIGGKKFESGIWISPKIKTQFLDHPIPLSAQRISNSGLQYDTAFKAADFLTFNFVFGAG